MKTETPPEIFRLLDVKQLADSLGVSIRHIKNLQSRRLIPYIRVGTGLRSPIRFELDEVRKALLTMTVPAKIRR